MLAILEIVLKNDSGVYLGYNTSSLFHGVLMEKIDTEYATYLHENSLRPYSQSVYSDGDKVIWIIRTLNSEAYEKIILKLLDNEFKSIKLKKKALEIEIMEKSVKQCSYSKLLEERYFEDSSRYIRIKFCTPTAFKSKYKSQVKIPTLLHLRFPTFFGA